MKRKILIMAGMLLAGMVGSGAAWAHGGWGHGGHFHGGFHHAHARVGVFVGVPLAPYPYYYPRYYYPAPVVVTPASPPVYIEQGQSSPPTQNYWYYCQNPQGYYPYVKECPGGWQQVPPQPPSQ